MAFDVVATVGRMVEGRVPKSPDAARKILEAAYGFVALSAPLKGSGTYERAVERFNGAIARTIVST